MICQKCHHDLAECTCEDLAERFADILDCQFVFIGEDYQRRIHAQINRNKAQQSKNE